MPLIQQEVGPLKLLCNRKLLQSRGIDLAGVNHNLPPARSTGIWLYVSLNLNARLYASREKEIENLSVDLALPDCALYNSRAVSNEEEDDSSIGSFVLEPSSDENLFAVQATCEYILDPDSFFQTDTPDEQRESLGMDYLRIPETRSTVRELSETQEKTTKRLAELKSYLEKKVAEHQAEIHNLQSFLETVDNILAEKSYRRVQLPKSLPNSPTVIDSNPPQTIRTISGVLLADIFVEGQDLRIVPSKDIKFDANAPPLRSFLVGKVLEPLHVKDEESTRTQQLSPDQVLSYEIDREATSLKQIHVKNYGDERRLNELKNALRWTFRRMYEKTIGTQ